MNKEITIRAALYEDLTQLVHLAKMLDEVHSDYRFRFDLIRNHVSELIHLAL